MNEKSIIVAVVVLVVLAVVIYFVRKNAQATKNSFSAMTGSPTSGASSGSASQSAIPSASALKAHCTTYAQPKLCKSAVEACYPLATASAENDIPRALRALPACSKAVAKLSPKDAANMVMQKSNNQACMPHQLSQVLPHIDASVASTGSLLRWAGKVADEIPTCGRQKYGSGGTVGTTGPTSTRSHQDSAGSDAHQQTPPRSDGFYGMPEYGRGQLHR